MAWLSSPTANIPTDKNAGAIRPSAGAFALVDGMNPQPMIDEQSLYC
jgi:hypothetical protein